MMDIEEWNIWRVMLHPKLALYSLDNADIMEKELRRRLEATLGELDAERETTRANSLEISRLADSIMQKETELKAVRSELDDVLRQLEEAREELEQRRDVETQLKEFDAKLTKVEDLKRGYEKRIDDLQRRLRDAVGRLSAREGSDLLDPGEESPKIDMKQRQTVGRVITPAQPAAEPQAKPARVAGIPSRKPSAEARRMERRNANNDDWLMDLPDDI